MKFKSSDNWFVLQVLGGKEQKTEEFLNKIAVASLRPFLPKKKIKIRKKGQAREMIKPLYPGYVFIVGKWDIKEAKKILQIPGTVKFVGGINSPGVVQRDEKETIKKITKDGLAGYSKVIKEGSKIKVMSGPLKELEGEIISVDRRKQRAIVKLPLLNSMVKVTLGFEYIDSNEEN